MSYYRVFNLKVDRQLRSEYFTSDAIYNGSAGMILYYMCRSWQDCCRRGKNRSRPSVSVESLNFNDIMSYYRVFNLKVDRQLSREYFRSNAIYNGSAGMTLYYYMCRSWQDCCRRGENRSWLSVSAESVDSKYWCLNNAIFTLL
jgi:hypothetical protein